MLFVIVLFPFDVGNEWWKCKLFRLKLFSIGAQKWCYVCVCVCAHLSHFLLSIQCVSNLSIYAKNDQFLHICSYFVRRPFFRHEWANIPHAFKMKWEIHRIFTLLIWKMVNAVLMIVLNFILMAHAIVFCQCCNVSALHSASVPVF